MKILFVHDHPFYKDNNDVYSGGGLPNFVWDNYLKYFNEVIVFGRLSTSEKDKKIISSGSNGLRFVLTRNYQSIKSLFFNFLGLVKEISDEVKKSDIVLVRLPSVLGIITSYIAIKNNKKIIVEQVGNGKEALIEHGSFVGKILASLFHLLNKNIVSKADYVSYVTINKLQQDYPTKALSTSLSNVVLNEIVDPELINQKKFLNEIFNIGIIGGFDVRYKGQDVLLKAISILPPEQKKNIHLYFVGKGDFSWILNLANEYNLSENIKYMGSKEAGTQIFDFLTSLSLYVQPSLTEGMPRALLEAMSVGCPGIGSDVGGIPDVVTKDYIHKKGDYKMLSQHINSLMIDRKKLQIESKRSVAIVQPYLKSRLDKKRELFYLKIINDLKYVETY